MAKATLSLSKMANAQGEYPILVRLTITRTNRPQFKSDIAVKPEYFVDEQIRIPPRSKHNQEFRDDLIQKKTALETFVASLRAISQSLPEASRTRKEILEVYKVVKSVAPAEICRTTIIAKKKEQDAVNKELARGLQKINELSVLEYCQKRVEGIQNGTLKRKGNKYSPKTLENLKAFVSLLERFHKRHAFDWEDISEHLIDEFVSSLESCSYMKRSANQYLSVFSTILNAALKDGYRFRATVLNCFPQLKVTNEDKTSAIYLTEDEVQALYEMSLTGTEDEVRDVFLAGCYTCQRYSDYSRISERNISFHDGICIVSIIQQKTGNEVSVPVLNNNLVNILEKYNYSLPLVSNRILNKTIKKVMCKLSDTVPSLKQEIPTPLTLKKQRLEAEGKVRYKRNSRGEALIPRYDLVSSHTARRTGITLLYLSKMLDSHEMMSISGHKTEAVFNEYIKVSGVELATNIAKKVANAKKENQAKAALMEQLEKLSAAQLATLLDIANNNGKENAG